MAKKTSAKSKDEAENKPRNAVSYHKRPENMQVAQWQTALRRQFAETHTFNIEKRDESFSPFGDYTVFNPETGNDYKMSFRGMNSPMNFCSCMDFKTNRLGTCKHLEALYHLLNNNNYLSNINKEYTPEYSSVYLSYREGREVKIRFGNDVSIEFEALVGKYFDGQNTLRPEAIDTFDDFITQALQIDGTFRCYDDALDYVLALRDNKARKTIAAKYLNDSDFAPLLNAKLFPYQKDGIRFAFEAGRSLNADEMGLGKTIQAIGAAQMFRRERGIEKTLIVCPTSLKYQWQSEIKRFTGEDALVIEGAPYQRKEQYERDYFFKIVSYHTVVNDISRVVENGFDLIILDEAQRIKNWKTKIAQGIKKLQTPYCIVLTGTPLENKIEELYSIVQFVNPYALGPYWHFLDYYQVKDDGGKVIGYQHLDEIATLLADIVKRRRKTDVRLQLPDRMDKNLFVPMTVQQMDIHSEYQDAVARLVNKWRRLGFLTEKDRQMLLNSLCMMRMSCDSTFLFDQKTRHDTKIDELMNILSEHFETKENKAVIFSQWERMTRIIARELDAAGIEYQYLHGDVPSKDRKALFDTFNSRPACRVFLSTDAGSTGLNLQAASLIINMDIPWNPAVLEQRIARIHRMGQTNAVQVINFVSKDTIEERMLGVLKFKSSLAEGILDNGDAAIFLTESKFNSMMNDIEKMTVEEQETLQPVAVSDEEENEEIRQMAQTEQPAPKPDATTAEEPFLFGDDDFKPVDAISKTTEPVKSETSPLPSAGSQTPPTEASELIAQGLSFFSGLAQTLSTPDGANRLARSIVEKDPQTGRSHLKIPVESEETVSNVLNLLGNLFHSINLH